MITKMFIPFNIEPPRTDKLNTICLVLRAVLMCAVIAQELAVPLASQQSLLLLALSACVGDGAGSSPGTPARPETAAAPPQSAAALQGRS